MRRRIPWLLCLVLATLSTGGASLSAAERRWPTDILRETFGYGEETPTDVPWSELVQGCDERDCIPAIDQPQFVDAAGASFLVDGDLVVGLARNGVSRAYPAYILDRHEIVNDAFGDERITITWCPLCGSALAFVGTLEGKPLSLGVSGLLRESDLVFYDRETRSLWQQVTGTAFAGPLRGRRLEAVAVSVTTWGRWRAAHPATEVLSTDSARPDRPAYGDYTSSERLMFPVSRRSARLHPKTVVWGIEQDGASAAITERRLEQGGPVELELGDSRVRAERLPDGSVAAQRIADGRAVVAHRMFWFAWYTFHPGTTIEDEESER